MIAVIDFGSQTTQLIARKIREMGIFAEIFPNTIAPEALSKAQGLILSGGPESTLSESHPEMDPGIWNLDIPILGICYGFQSMALHYGASIAKGKREYGKIGRAHV